MKKIMFGNSLMLFGIALLIVAGLEIMPICFLACCHSCVGWFYDGCNWIL